MECKNCNLEFEPITNINVYCCLHCKAQFKEKERVRKWAEKDIKKHHCYGFRKLGIGNLSD